MHHAWILEGSRGIGKAIASFMLARHLSGSPVRFDQHRSGQAAISDDDVVARQIAHGSHPGVIHVSRPAAERGGGFKTQITVDEIRRLAHFFQRTNGRSWRIAIVDPADDLNRNAANALLKILEEPPERAIFLVISHAPGRLLPTIRSRCRLLRFNDLSLDEITRGISRVLPERATDARSAAMRAEGSMRTAFLLLESDRLALLDRIDQLFAAPRTRRDELYAAAEMLSQKGQEETFELLTAHLFSAIARETNAFLRTGQSERSERLAAFWLSEMHRWRAASAFNLDRKQTLITFFERLSEARSAS